MNTTDKNIINHAFISLSYELPKNPDFYIVINKIINDIREAERKKNSKDISLDFYKWVVKNNWQEHSSKKYFYWSEDANQWPPEKAVTEDELFNMFLSEYTPDIANENKDKLTSLLVDLLNQQEEIINSPIRFNGVHIERIKQVFKEVGVELKTF